MEEAGIDPVLFGLTDKDYELLSKNFAQIRQKLQETNSLLEEYKKYYEGEENAEEVFKKLEEAGIDPVLFGITDKDFQVLARNFAQIRQKLQETNNLLEEYKKYYEGEEKK